jgi:hypothetical protein
MRILIVLFALFAITNCLGQTDTANRSIEKGETHTSSPGIIFFDSFDNNKNNWTVADNKNVSARISGGSYYLTALGHAYGEGQEVKIDARKNFEIEARIKLLSGNAEHKNYYSMLFWGREGLNGYYFTFAKDGFASVQICDGKNQRSCITESGSLRKTTITESGSLRKTTLNADDFNVFLIRKAGNMYSFFINGAKIYEMPFTPFFGNLVGFGAGRRVGLEIDYFKVRYL